MEGGIRMKPSIRDIARATAKHYDLKVDALKSQGNGWAVSRPRMMAMTLCRQHTGRSTPEIGRWFNRDHTTVIHACRFWVCTGTAAIENAAVMESIMTVALEFAAKRLALEAEWVSCLHTGSPPQMPVGSEVTIYAPIPRRKNAAWAIPVLVPARVARAAVKLPTEISRPTKAQLMGRRA
jgi:hypothetical protein